MCNPGGRANGGRGTRLVFALGVESDPKDSKKPILSLSPGDLPLPGHLNRLFMQAGDTIQQTMSEEGGVVGIATKLARASTNGADSADPDKRYHVLSLAEPRNSRPILTPCLLQSDNDPAHRDRECNRRGLSEGCR